MWNMKLDALKRELATCRSELQKTALFLAFLSQEIMNMDPGKDLTVVGGLAVELYTQGDYSTKDIDVLAPKESLFNILKEWDFVVLPDNRTWYSPDLDIRVEWVGRGMVNDDPLAQEHREVISIGQGLKITVISREDIILDRLTCAKWQNRPDDLNWAALILAIADFDEKPIDRNYLLSRSREKQFDVEDLVSRIVEMVAEFRESRDGENERY
jgi:hypothetical protein